MAEITLTASMENLNTVINFIKGRLEQANCSRKIVRQVVVAVEEVFVNIAQYAYNPKSGPATIRCEVDPVQVYIVFVDRGTPYDPLAKKDPDVSLKAKERTAGGLGIFMTKQLMDDIRYEFKDGQNILKICKTL